VVIHQPYGSPFRYAQRLDYAAAKAGDPETARQTAEKTEEQTVAAE
jgi:hypothetical protein